MCISLQTYKAYRGGVFTLTRLLLPAWAVHYYVKYHVTVSQQNCFTFVTLVKISNKCDTYLIDRIL